MGSEENGIGIGEGAFLVGYSNVVFFFVSSPHFRYSMSDSLLLDGLPFSGGGGAVANSWSCLPRSVYGSFFWLGHVINFCLVGSLHFDYNGCVTLAVSSFFFGGSAEDVYEYAYHGPRRSVDTRLKMQKYASAK